MSEKVRPTKLKFKGEKSKKKRKREDGEEGSSKKHRRREDDEGSSDTWVLPEQATEIRGPTYILHPSEPPICITYDSTRGRIVLHSVDKGKTEDGSDRKSTRLNSSHSGESRMPSSA